MGMKGSVLQEFCYFVLLTIWCLQFVLGEYTVSLVLFSLVFVHIKKKCNVFQYHNKLFVIYFSVNYYMDIYGMILLFSLPASPIIGVVMDWKRQFGKS